MPDLPGSAELLMVSRCLQIQMRATEAIEAGDVETLEAHVGDLLDLVDDSDDEWSFLPLFELGVVHLALASLTGSVDSLRSAVHYQEQALTGPGAPQSVQPLLDMGWAPLLTLNSYLEPSVDRIQEGIRRTRATLRGVPVMADQRVRARSAIGLALDAVYGLTGDPSVLDEMITELECTEEELGQASGASAAAVHWQLADAYGRRAAHEGRSGQGGRVRPEFAAHHRRRRTAPAGRPARPPGRQDRCQPGAGRRRLGGPRRAARGRGGLPGGGAGAGPRGGGRLGHGRRTAGGAR